MCVGCVSVRLCLLWSSQKMSAAIVDSAVTEIDLRVFRIHDLNVNKVSQNLLFAR